MKKIIVVDDDDSIRRTFFLILHQNYQVYLAKDLKEALKHFGHAKIDLIIADLKLPGMSGLEMISQFRENGFKGEAILISAYPDLINLAELKRLSVRHFFVKPLDLRALNQSIDNLLSTKKKKKIIRAKTAFPIRLRK